MDQDPVRCSECNVHFAITPGMVTDGLACPECGGKRLFRDQPSPTQSDGTLRDMVDSDTQIDQGGNPLGEGTIMGTDGERPAFKRDNFMHSKVAEFNVNDPRSHNKYPTICPDCGSGLKWQGNEAIPRDVWDATGLEGAPVVERSGMRDVYPVSECPNCHWPHREDVQRNGEGEGYQGEYGTFVNPQTLGPVRQGNTSHSATESVMDRPETFNTEPYAPLWHEAADIGPAGAFSNGLEDATQMRQYENQGGNIPGNFSPAQLAVGVGTALLPGVGAAAADALGVGGSAAAAEAGAAEDAASGGIGNAAKGIGQKILQKGVQDLGGHELAHGIGSLMRGALGQGSGGSAVGAPSAAPNIMQMGASTKDIPMLLVADTGLTDMYQSVPSIDEQSDEPWDQDQKQFDSGDRTPSNFHNPNLEDSGMNGEDNTRTDSAQWNGFPDTSPGLERAHMVMPLLMHYYNSDESGERDPVIRGVHEALEQEHPGYLTEHHPDADAQLEQFLQGYQNPSPMGVHAHTAAGPLDQLPGGQPTTGTMPGQAPVNPMPQPQMQTGTCPHCGGVLGPDGSCPQCGNGNNGTMVPPTPLTPMQGIAAHLATHQGPVTPEQIAAVQEVLISEGRDQECPNVPLHPEQYAKEMAQIQNNPNVAPQVDPSQLQQTPPPAMQQAPGGMPVTDPSQAGGGGMPMQPMSSEHTADANTMTPRCPKCGSGTTTLDVGGDPTSAAEPQGHCHACGNIFDIGAKQGSLLRKGEVELPNPALMTQPEPHMKWADVHGQDLMPGMTYELHSAAFSVPTEIKIVSVKPEGIDAQLVGGIAGDLGAPPLKISRQEAQLEKYEFVPIHAADTSTEPDTTPGQSPEQVPPIETTDETPEVTPHSHEGSVENPFCQKCGSTMVDERMLSPEVTAHDCVHCGNHWETKDEDPGTTASIDLSWLDESPLEMSDRFTAMERAAGGQSRSLSDIAAKDQRLQEIKARLDANEKLAGKYFSPSEKRALIDETGKARNLEDLDLEGTHYDTRVDYSGMTNPDLVDDDHFALGL